LLLIGCGQDDVKFPEMAGPGGVCGPWYPGGEGGADTGVDGGAEAEYAIAKDAVFPCAVWESARLDGQDIYIDVNSVYLDSKHGMSDTRALIIVVSAKNCNSCITLINAIADRAAQFEEAGAYMVVLARRDQYAMNDPDLTLDQAYEVAVEDGWPVESWPVINDEEYYFSSEFDTVAPWVVVVSVKDMVVQVRDTTSFVGEYGVIDLLEYLQGPEFD
jgi:hypothetical protein